MILPDGTEKKIGLALGAGGARGFCHVGVLKALEENGIKPDLIAGSSMGALVGGCYCAGVPLDLIERESLRASNRMMTDLDMRLRYKRGLVRGSKLKKYLTRQIGKGRKIEDLELPYLAVSVDIVTGDLIEITSGDLVSAIRASAAIPMVFRPVMDGDKMLVDGGVLCRVPVTQTRKMGADVVIAVDALGELHRIYGVPRNFISVLRRAMLVMDFEITKLTRDEADIFLVPDMGKRSEFRFRNNGAAIEAGYNAAMAEIGRIKRIVFSDDK
ncbi:MAG: patatin-like phospholipase family protein [Firmicutes bacterium]|nr:patatin-like phospholipase family protein [Bacillota bacterium]